MAHKLTAAQKAEIRKLVDQVDAAKSNLMEHMAEVRADLEASWDERSDRWKEGTAGIAARELLDNLQALEDEVDNIDIQAEDVLN